MKSDLDGVMNTFSYQSYRVYAYRETTHKQTHTQKKQLSNIERNLNKIDGGILICLRLRIN